MSESYIQFNFVRRSQSGKTKVFEVTNTSHGERLGEISWNAHWRKYVFIPNAWIQFDAVCLDDIARFLQDETKEHRNGLS